MTTTGSSRDALPAIDAHAHVFVRGLALAPHRRYAPDYDATRDAYIAHLDRHGLSHGLLVQPSFLGTDNGHLVASLKHAPGRLRGIAVIGPATEPEELEALADAGVVGIRLNLVDEPLPDLETPAWVALLDAFRERAWSVEIHRSALDAARLATMLADAGLDVVLDHFALPSAVDDAGFARILALGASRKVWVKLSAPYRLGLDGERLAMRLYPLLRDAFGPDRLMWGSDWPHTRFEQSQTYDRNRQFLDALVPVVAERERILAAPQALFRFAAG